MHNDKKEGLELDYELKLNYTIRGNIDMYIFLAVAFFLRVYILSYCFDTIKVQFRRGPAWGMGHF